LVTTQASLQQVGLLAFDFACGKELGGNSVANIVKSAIYDWKKYSPPIDGNLKPSFF
jgi:hypothetical protein